jgi:hypothetical protein
MCTECSLSNGIALLYVDRSDMESSSRPLVRLCTDRARGCECVIDGMWDHGRGRLDGYLCASGEERRGWVGGWGLWTAARARKGGGGVRERSLSDSSVRRDSIKCTRAWVLVTFRRCGRGNRVCLCVRVCAWIRVSTGKLASVCVLVCIYVSRAFVQVFHHC